MHTAERRRNIKRGLFRVWLFVAALWLIVAGGIWVAVWIDKLERIGGDLAATLKSAPDYEAICAKIRSQRAAGVVVNPTPAIPALELTVENGIGRVVAAPGRCLVVIAKEENIGLVPVALRVVKSDGTTLRQIEDRDGVPVQESAIGVYGQPMLWSLVFVLGVPLVLFIFGYGVWWVARGFTSDPPRPRREPQPPQ
jgi:hypothetical protein